MRLAWQRNKSGGLRCNKRADLRMLRKPSFVNRKIPGLRDTLHEKRFTIFQLAAVDHRQLARPFRFLLDA